MGTKTKMKPLGKKRAKPALPVVHLEIVGEYPGRLQKYYGQLFGWKCDTVAPAAKEISQPGKFGFIDRIQTDDGTGIPGGIGGGRAYAPHTIFYIGVPDVEAALQQAEALGGKRRLGPAINKDGNLAVGHFLDPEGNLVGVAGPVKVTPDYLVESAHPYRLWSRSLPPRIFSYSVDLRAVPRPRRV